MSLLILGSVPFILRSASASLQEQREEIPEEILSEEKELDSEPTGVGRGVRRTLDIGSQLAYRGLRSLSSSSRNGAGAEVASHAVPRKSVSMAGDSGINRPPLLLRQKSAQIMGNTRRTLKGLMWFFIVGASVRLLHAWHTFHSNDNTWPAGGVSDYLAEANSQQVMVTIHVTSCTAWTAILFYQFFTGLSENRRQVRAHKVAGYVGIVVGAVAALTGWLSIWTLAVPSHVAPFIKAQLFVGGPGFFTEALWGVMVLVKDRDWRRHRKHMTLSLIGTVADAGNGFSISFTRWLFEGTPHQQWAQDVGVLSLNVISIIPFLLPALGPHWDFFVTIKWKELCHDVQKHFTFQHYMSIITVVGSICLLTSNLVGLSKLLSM